MAKIPSKAEILTWISDNPHMTSKRDIAKAFGIKGAARIDLKRILRELESEGHLQKRKKTYRDSDSLPPVSVLRVGQPNIDGDLFADPLEWHGEGDAPKVMIVSQKDDPALGKGERILARLKKVKADDHDYEARLIRRIQNAPQKILGIFRETAEGGRIMPIDKKSDREWMVPAKDCAGAKDGELVEANQTGPKTRMGLPKAKIVARLGNPFSAKSVSLMAIASHQIPNEFEPATLEDAERAKPAAMGKRMDLRDLPFVTIDPATARDHDDAVFAEIDPDSGNTGGYIIWVAIADVAHYVTPGSALDKEARHRGNSSYFPDRVVPMLPDRLSGNLCSLHEDATRPVMAVRMVFDKDGELTSHKFHRAMIKSVASLSYEEAQEAYDGQPSERCVPLMDTVINPLFAAYYTMEKAREKRQPLALDLPERQIELSDDGVVTSVRFRDRLTAHKLIEECMVMANVAAGETLLQKRTPLVFRVHEEPTAEKLHALRETAQAAGLNLAKGQVLQTKHLNRLLEQAQNTDSAELINISTLRSMTQAYYHPENLGHFGLSLRAYAHFTSPIRRYADLIVHRALVTAHGFGDDGLTEDDIERMGDTATHISETERRSMLAERDTTDRYLAAYLSDRLGNEFDGRISGVTKFGAFIKLDETGADGLVPVRSLGREYFHFDADRSTLTGEHTRLTLSVGKRVTVRLAEASPQTGGVILELITLGGEKMPSSKGRGGSRKRGSGKRKSSPKRSVNRRRK